MKQKTILFAPLNWGLGHATRCVPLIYAAQSRGFRVVLASDGEAGRLLRHEFPDVEFIELPSYHIRYPFDNILINILYLLPRISWAILRENILCRRLIREMSIDAIISDNRYGMFYMGSRRVKNIFLGHQLNIKINAKTDTLNTIEKGIAWAQRLYLNTFFSLIAVPDIADYSESLAGVLDHYTNEKPNFPLVYIGVQSRFSLYKSKNTNFSNEVNTIKKRVLILLSGPEPQRTRLEIILEQEARKNTNYQFTLIQGVQQATVITTVLSENITRISHAFTSDLADFFTRNDIIICRSGYSTLMDLAFFRQKKLILIPTPGQTEQEYLAYRLAQKRLCTVQEQAQIDLAKVLRSLETINFFAIPNTGTVNAEESLDTLFSGICNRNIFVKAHFE